MKKYLIIAFLILLPTISFATSGACSSHGGVNCSVLGVYATCNDFTKSSVFFNNVIECKDTKCYYPIASCSEELLQLLQSQKAQATSIANWRGFGDTDWVNQQIEKTSQEYDQKISQCKTQIEGYKLQQISYQSCLSSQSNIMNPVPVTIIDKEEYVNTEMQKWCVDKYGPNSFNDTVNKTCSCNAGYEFDSGYKSCQKIVTCDSNQIKQNNKCVDVNQACMTYFGPHSIAIPNTAKDGSTQCSCDAGYEWAKNKADGCMETKLKTSINTTTTTPLTVEKKVQIPKAINPIKEIPKIVKPVATEAWVDSLTQETKPIKQSFFKRISSWFTDLFK
ncbi:MAG: hypothetical protein NTX85_03045 [Candidatus Nomurabacteria bacterium]|nr:hypothetical protein [Candidatus Nomurabacteria bacterium]